MPFCYVWIAILPHFLYLESGGVACQYSFFRESTIFALTQEAIHAEKPPVLYFLGISGLHKLEHDFFTGVNWVQGKQGHGVGIHVLSITGIGTATGPLTMSAHFCQISRLD